MQDTQQLQSAISTFPLPLAQALRRAVNAKSPQEQHNGAYYFFESALKLSASAQLGVYFSIGCPHRPLNQLIENLTRPSVGHWLALLRETAAFLAARQDSALLPLQGVSERLTRKQAMPAVKAFLEFAARASDKQEGRQTFRVLDFFDAVVSYRNQELGHGAMRERGFYAEAAPLLLEAALETVNALRPVGDLQFVVARDVVDPRTQMASRRFDVLRGDGLHLPLETNQPRDAEIPAGRLLLAAGATRVQLHPLLVYEIDKLDRDRVGFLNHVAAQGRGDTQKLKRVEYLDYDSGDRIEGIDALTELAALLSKVRGQAVSIEAVAALSQSGTEINVGAAPSDKGQFIGDFELLEELGRGGMGIVYKARQNSLRRVVALKVLPPGLAGDPVSVARFKREIAALGRCDHPNVVKVLTAGQDGERHFYAMEYVEGSDLAQVCGVLSKWKTGSLKEGHILKAITDSRAHRAPGAKTGQAPLPEVPKAAEIVPDISEGRDYFTRLAEILGDAASGVQHLHEHGIIHRDLKPANVMLTGDGKRAVIMDLGLAQLQDRSLSLTASSVKILGTLRYMPPEQLQHQMLEVTPKADIYSLGATLYELVALAPMFDGDTEARLMQQVLQEDPRPARSHNAAIPRDLETIITVATAKSPTDRYASAGIMAQDLRAFSRGEPISARAPTTFHYLKLFYRKNTRMVQGMAAALVVLLALTAWFIVRLDESRADAETSAELAREKEAQAKREAERANKAEKDAKDKAIVAQKARDEANTQKGVAEAKTREVEAALKEAARNLQQIHMERGKAAAERGEPALALNHFAQAAAMAEELNDDARFKQAWAAFCDNEPRVPFELWRTQSNGFAGVRGNMSVSRDGSVMAGYSELSATCVETATGRTLARIHFPGLIDKVALSGDGRLLLVADWTRSQLWDVNSATQLCELKGVKTNVRAALFNAANDKLSVLDGDGNLFQFDCTGKELSKVSLAKNVYSAVATPDGSQLLVYGTGDRFELFDTTTWKSLKAFQCSVKYVYSMAVSPGAKAAMISTDGGKVVVWDIESARELAALALAPAYGNSLAFAPDGSAAILQRSGELLVFEGDWAKPRVVRNSILLAGSAQFMPDGRSLVIGRYFDAPLFVEVATGKSLMDVPGVRSTVYSMEWSPDNSLVAVGTADDSISLLDAATGLSVRTLDKLAVFPSPLRFLPDGRRIAAATKDRVGVCVLDIQTGEVVVQYPMQEKEIRVRDIVCSPDGRFIYVAIDGGKILRYPANSIAPVRTFEVNRGDVRGVNIAFVRVSADGTYLTVVDWAGYACRIAADDGSMLRNFAPPAGETEILALNKEGTKAVFAARTSKLNILDYASGKIVSTDADPVPPYTFQFAENGDLIATDGLGRVRAINPETGTWRTLLKLEGDKPYLVNLDGPGGCMLVAGEGGYVAKFAFESARKLNLPEIKPMEVFELFWVPGTSLLAVGGGGAPVKIVDLNTGRIAVTLGDAKALARVGFSASPDGNTLICGGMGSQVDALEIPTGATRMLYEIPVGHMVFATAFSPDGSLIALAQMAGENSSSTCSIVLLRSDGRAPARQIALDKGMCVFVRFISDGKQLLVGRMNARPVIVDVASGSLVAEIGEECGETLGFDVDTGRTLAVLPGKDSALLLCELPSGKVRGTLAGHTGRVVRAIFSPDAKLIASMSSDSTLRVWDAATFKEIAQTPCKQSTDLSGLAFTSDGKSLIYSAKESSLNVWDFNKTRNLSDLEGVKARDVVALAQRLTRARLKGLELVAQPLVDEPVCWNTSNRKPPMPMSAVSLDRPPVAMSSAVEGWWKATQTWLVDWNVKGRGISWRQRRAAWRYTETLAASGQKVIHAVPATAPWAPDQYVDQSGFWENEQYHDEVYLFHLLRNAEIEGRWKEAFDRADSLTKNGSSDEWLQFRRGRAALNAGFWDIAFDAYTKYLKSDPENLTALAGTAVAAMSDEGMDRSESLERLQKAISAGVRTTAVFVAKARYAYYHDEYELAIEASLEALKIDANCIEAIALLGDIYVLQGKSEDADKWLSKALELAPGKPELWTKRAEVRNLRGNVAGAIADCSACIKLYEDNRSLIVLASLYRAYMARAGLYESSGDKEKALADYSKAIEELPNDYEARLARGNLHLEKAQWLDAFTDFEVCSTNSEDQGSTHLYGSGRAALELGDYGLAAESLREFISSGSNDPRLIAPLFAARAEAMLADGIEKGTLDYPCRAEETRVELKRQFEEMTQVQRQRRASSEIDSCFESLNRLAKENFQDAELLEKEPQLERARKDPRWAEVIKAVKANKK